MKHLKHSLIALALGTSSILTGCATATLLDKDDGIRTKTVSEVLINDYVVAFGKPAQVIPNIPQDSIVIVGQQYSYVLTHGGQNLPKSSLHLTQKISKSHVHSTFIPQKMMATSQVHSTFLMSNLVKM